MTEAGARARAAERPGLEYQYAFDLCAMEAHRAGGPVSLYSSSAFYAEELTGRLDRCGGVLVPCGGWAPAGRGWRSLPMAGVRGSTRFRLAPEGGEIAPGTAVVWAEPEMGDLERTAARVAQNLAPGGRLCVVTSGWLRRGLPEWKRDEGERPARRPAGLRRTMECLRQAGLTVEGVYGFHGPRSLAWGLASRVPAALGRADLVDRCLAAMRKGYVVPGWQARWAPVAVVLASTAGKSTGFTGFA